MKIKKTECYYEMSDVEGMSDIKIRLVVLGATDIEWTSFWPFSWRELRFKSNVPITEAKLKAVTSQEVRVWEKLELLKQATEKLIDIDRQKRQKKRWWQK